MPIGPFACFGRDVHNRSVPRIRKREIHQVENLASDFMQLRATYALQYNIFHSMRFQEIQSDSAGASLHGTVPMRPLKFCEVNH